MDDNLFYDTRADGCFCVHFANKKGLSVNEIKEFFSQFGEVLYVNCAGDEHGFRFVTLRNEEDVKRCVAALRNHEFVKVLPKRHKVQETNGIKSKQDGNLKQSRKNQKKQTEDFNVPSNDNFFDNGIVKHGKQLESNLNQSMLSEFSRIRNNRMRENNSCNDREENKLVQEDKDQMPELISVDKFVPQNLQTPSNGILPQPKTVLAQEVIIANIHLNLGIHYITHLVEKYNPICVSPMKTLSSHNIRYCHVYFKTSQEAIATEKEFDRLALCGMALIVLRAHKLMEEWNSQ